MIRNIFKIPYLKKKFFALLGFFFISLLMVQSQDQSLADSLEIIFSQGIYEKKDKLRILKELTVNQGETVK